MFNAITSNLYLLITNRSQQNKAMFTVIITAYSTTDCSCVSILVAHQYHYHDDTWKRLRHLTALERGSKTASKGHKTSFWNKL